MRYKSKLKINYNTYVWSKAKKEEDEESGKQWSTFLKLWWDVLTTNLLCKIIVLLYCIITCLIMNRSKQLWFGDIHIIPKIPIFITKKKKESKRPISKERLKIHYCNFLFYFIIIFSDQVNIYYVSYIERNHCSIHTWH